MVVSYGEVVGGESGDVDANSRTTQLWRMRQVLKSTGWGNIVSSVTSQWFMFTACVAVALVSAAYVYGLAKVSASSVDGICKVLQEIDVAHSCTQPVERNHVEDCCLQLSSLLFVLDRYVLAHFLGWFVKALIVPDAILLWVASIMFEIIERLLIFWIPTFEECWWDSLILDIMLCNALGIHLGCHIGRFTNHNFNYRILSIRFRPLTFCTVLFGMLWTDVNAFLIKDLLHIRTDSPLNIYRLLGFVILAKMSVVQLTYPSRLNFGAVIIPVVYTFILAVELFVWTKRSKDFLL